MIKEKQFEPEVSAYLRKNGGLYINPTSLLKGIASVAVEPYFAFTKNDSTEELGNAVLKAKNYSSGYIERENRHGYVPGYLELAAVKNYSQFSKHTKHVFLIFQTEHIKFTSTVNKRGDYRGFDGNIALIKSDSSPAQIGEQLMKSLEISIA